MSGTSGTVAFNPALSDLVLDAYERCGKLAVELTQHSQMIASARRSANLVLSGWANKGIQLWKVEQVIQTMVPGQVQYFDDASCIDVLADSVVIRWYAGGIPASSTIMVPLTDDQGRQITDDQGNPIMVESTTTQGTAQLTDDQGRPIFDDQGNPIMVDSSAAQGAGNYTGVYTDIRLYPISRTDWMSLPQKLIMQDRTTSYWLDRQVIPVFNVWPQVNSANTYQLVYRRSRYVFDADIVGGQQLDVPQRFLKAFVSGLAADLAVKWAPERAVSLAAVAMQDWNEAAAEDEERVPLYIAPDMTGYYT